MLKLSQCGMSVLGLRCLGALSILLILLFVRPVAGQQPFADGETKGTLFLGSGGFLQFNAADTSIRFGYLFDESTAKRKRDRIFGVGLTAKLTDKQGSFLGSNKIAASAGFDISAGLRYVFTKKFDPATIEITPAFVSRIEHILREDKTISKDTKLLTVDELADRLTSSIPKLTLKAKEKFMASLKEAIKSLGDGTDLKAYLEALQITSKPEQAEKLKPTIANLVAKQKIKEKLEALVKELEGPATTVADWVNTINAAIAADEKPKETNATEAAELKLSDYINKTELEALTLSAKTIASFEQNEKPSDLREKRNQAYYVDALTSLCAALDKKDSFCEINGKVLDIFDLPELKRYANVDRLVFQGGYKFSQYNLFDPAAAFADQLSKKNFNNPSAQLIYNYQMGGNKLMGVGVGVEKANNIGDLTEIDVRDFMSTVSGPTTREFGRTKKAMLGDFKQYTRSFINTDFAYYPESLKGLFGINFFTRSELTGQKVGIRPGIGLFLSKKGDPTKVIGGLSVSLDEKRHAKISLVAGYNF